ncbi:MAG: amidohydrolase [Kiritimatiellae bacterium]|nr:amidohydrolase [Kiritimatiellia bacterium]
MKRLRHRDNLKGVPIIDVHTHPPGQSREALSSYELDEELERRMAAMDALNVRKSVLLCLGFETKKAPNSSHARSERAAFHFLNAAPDRFVVFTTVDFSRMDSRDFTARAVSHLESTVRAGARGLKLELGKPAMRWMPMDDPRMDPIYAKAGQLGIPIMYHSGDPQEFFHPDARYNFWLGVKNIPSEMRYWRVRDKVPSFDQLCAERDNMLRKHPGTTFVFPHMGHLERQLALLADLLERYPNVYVDSSWALANGARSPNDFAAFLTDYADRVLFGSDGGIGGPKTKDGWTLLFQRDVDTLESDRHDLAIWSKRREWRVHGLNLTKGVLEKIYYRNAKRLLARPVKIPAG